MGRLSAAALLLMIAAPAAAEGEFAKGSEIESWKGLQGRENAYFEAEVVDIVCALSGDCPADCGGGSRQIGLLRSADGKLVLAAKNAQFQFNGATEDLHAYCGQTVMVDGLLVANPALTDTKLYQVHRIRRKGATEWAAAKGWTEAWKRKHPKVAGRDGPWYRHDPGVQGEIEANGYLGIGHEADAVFIEKRY